MLKFFSLTGGCEWSLITPWQRVSGFILLSALSLTIVSEKDKQNKRPAWIKNHAGLFSKP